MASDQESLPVVPLEDITDSPETVLRIEPKISTDELRRNFSADELQLSSNGLKWENKRDSLLKKKGGNITTNRTLQLQELKQRLHEKFTRYQFGMTTLFLTLAGIITALIGALIDLFIAKGFWWARAHIMDVTDYVFPKYLLWLLFLGGTLWIGVTFTLNFAPTSTGSGIPEMKTILSGSGLYRFLSFRTLIGKAIGLIFAVGSGASLGKVGPFVHMGGLIIYNLAQLPPFHKIKNNGPLMQQMLGVGCAIGYACSLGTPIAGVLLSIEVTSTYYAVRNYWFAYVGTISGAVSFLYIRNLLFGNPGLTPLIPTSLPEGGFLRFGILELILFIIMGAVIGCLAAGFIKLNALALQKWRGFCKAYAPYETKLKSPYVLVIILTLLTGTLTFPLAIGQFNSLPASSALADLFSPFEMDDPTLHATDWKGYPLLVSFLLFSISRFFLTAVSVLIPLPCGLYAPVLSLGGAIGRAIGEVAKVVLASLPSLLYEGGTIVPGGYAVVGAASFAAAVTHTQSSAIVIFELTGQLQYVLPVLVSVLTAIAVAKRIYPLSIYDSISKWKNLPYLPDIQNESAYDITARDIMRTNVKYIVRQFAYEDVMKLLAEDGADQFAVVENQDTMILLGTVDRSTLKNTLNEYFASRRVIQQQLAKDEPESFKFDISDQHTAPYDINSLPVQLLERTPLTQIHQLFITMRLDNALVITNGKLVGQVRREDLIKLMEKL